MALGLDRRLPPWHFRPTRPLPRDWLTGSPRSNISPWSPPWEAAAVTVRAPKQPALQHPHPRLQRVRLKEKGWTRPYHLPTPSTLGPQTTVVKLGKTPRNFLNIASGMSITSARRILQQKRHASNAFKAGFLFVHS